MEREHPISAPGEFSGGTNQKKPDYSPLGDVSKLYPEYRDALLHMRGLLLNYLQGTPGEETLEDYLDNNPGIADIATARVVELRNESPLSYLRARIDARLDHDVAKADQNTTIADTSHTSGRRPSTKRAA
jgi:hypothetical protein